MLCIQSNTFDIYEHLATEEFLLKEFSDDIFMLWRSDPSVVIGKHQNAMAEINYHYLRENNIAVARRLSGGGTVYHDRGNLNFTFILNGERGKLVDFVRFVQPINLFLNQLGIQSEIGVRNDILVSGLKVSGNAEHIFKNRVLHHGTLLYKANLDVLRNAIKVIPGKYIDKAVQSHRSSVTNLSDYMAEHISTEAFSEKLFHYVVDSNEGEIYSLSEDELQKIRLLRDSKYKSWNWIYGYSPTFSLHKSFGAAQQEYVLEVGIEKGLIISFNLTSPVHESDNYCELNNVMIGCRYDIDEIRSVLNLAEIDVSVREMVLEQLF